MKSVSLHCLLASHVLMMVSFEDDEIQQSVALKWLYEFLTFAQDVVVPFTPRLIPAVLPSLAHHVPDIQTAAIKLNQLLFSVIQNLPSVTPPASATTSQAHAQVLGMPARSTTAATSSPVRSGIPIPNATGGSFTMLSTSPQQSSPMVARPPLDGAEVSSKLRPIPPILEQPAGNASSNSSLVDKDGAISSSRPGSPPPDPERKPTAPDSGNDEVDPFDYHATVSALTVRFLSEYEDTRVAALKWLIMLHQKVPNKVNID
jgi:vacuole morphology and inheritance protein 14